MLKLLRDGAGALGLTLDDAQLAAFGRCCDLLLEKNAVMNLTAITEPAEVARLHFLDSLALLRLADFRGKRVVDVGCGAGFPGVPLLIGEPSIRLSLLDSTAKRMQWLSDELLPALGLEAECLTGRAEELIEGRRETYDLCVSRAKGAAAEDEAQEAGPAIRTLGGSVREMAEYSVGDAVHRVVIIDKIRPTPAKYPRRFAKIKQQPL